HVRHPDGDGVLVVDAECHGLVGNFHGDVGGAHVLAPWPVPHFAIDVGRGVGDGVLPVGQPDVIKAGRFHGVVAPQPLAPVRHAVDDVAGAVAAEALVLPQSGVQARRSDLGPAGNVGRFGFNGTEIGADVVDGHLHWRFSARRVGG